MPTAYWNTMYAHRTMTPFVQINFCVISSRPSRYAAFTEPATVRYATLAQQLTTVNITDGFMPLVAAISQTKGVITGQTAIDYDNSHEGEKVHVAEQRTEYVDEPASYAQALVRCHLAEHHKGTYKRYQAPG